MSESTRLLGGLKDVDQTLVGTNFELLTAFLIDVRRTENGILIDHRGKRDRAGNFCARLLRRVHDFPYGLIENAVVGKPST